MQDGDLLEALEKGELLSADCPSRDVLRHITSKWGVLILIALSGGKMRFSELRRMIQGISERMLAQSLRDLETYGIVTRMALPVVPPHVEYELSELGADLSSRVLALGTWIETNLSRMQAGKAAQADADTCSEPA